MSLFSFLFLFFSFFLINALDAYLVNYGIFSLFTYLERKSAIACENVKIETRFNTTTNNLANSSFNTTLYNDRLQTIIHDQCKHLGTTLVKTSHDYGTNNLSTSFKLIPPGNNMLASLNEAFSQCIQKINTKFSNTTSLVDELTNHMGMISIEIENMSVSTKNCCPGKLGYCCPTGHLARSTGGTVETVACCKYLSLFNER